jgi:hypothetical protein
MYVYFKRGDQAEEVGDLHRRFQRQTGRTPDWRAPRFPGWIPGIGLTVAEIDGGKREHHWWEDRLLEQGWLGMEIRSWELALQAAVRIEEHHPGGLRQFLAETS